MHFVPDKPSKAERRRSLALAAQEQLAQRRSQVNVMLLTLSRRLRVRRCFRGAASGQTCFGFVFVHVR